MRVNSIQAKVTDRTLAEQLKITDREIEQRKALLEFTESEVRQLKTCREYITERVDDIVDRFYQRQLDIAEIALLIGDAETLQRLRSSMRRYVCELFYGYYDAEYVNKRLRIGKVHQRIGVSPRLYISAICLLEREIVGCLRNDPSAANDQDAIEFRCQALHKLLMFDIQLVFDTYISTLVTEVESAKDQLEDYVQSLQETIDERTRQLYELSTRDALTGLLNHRAFAEALHREISISERTREPLALLYMDLNGFKRLNDLQGHQAGDTVLANVGKVLDGEARAGDLACRYGGDEFAVIMPRTNAGEARSLCERIIDAFERTETEGISFSVGIAVTSVDEPLDGNAFLKAADALMYEAKDAAREAPGFHIRLQGESPPKARLVG
ncbi:MAG: GGDEF domain-containing protein [Alphaproteobacteria bacterium]|jgi:diguanylate cyclase (GGDEF)-like protein|nr:GGDEF domain-containing protein [Alphaproteobacteria bacterium]